MSEMYQQWKQLRNYLGTVDPKLALEVLRYYSLFPSNMETLPPTPPDYIEVHQSVLGKVNNGILPWDMEILAREVILSSDNYGIGKKNFQRWSVFANAVNLLKSIDNGIAKESINQSNIFNELFRLSHRQFPHQIDSLNKVSLIRYAKLYSHPKVDPILVNKLKIDQKRITTCGLALYGLYESHAAVELPRDKWNEQGWAKLGITHSDMSHFLNFTSKTFDQLKKRVKSEHKVDDTFLYQYNPLSEAPLVELERDGKTTFICPSINKFQLRFTRGIYYELYMEKNFDNAFGSSFEEYIGEVLIKSTKGSKTKIYSEETDKSKNKKRCDWVIDQEKSFTIVECKTKRMAITGYLALDDEAGLIKQLTLLSEAIVQSYQAFLVYRDIGYEPAVYPYDSKKNAAICVVTLEKWFLYGKQLKKLREIVKEELIKKSIDPKIMQTVPFSILGSDELEKLAFLAGKDRDISEMIKKHNDVSADTATWEFGVQINKDFKNDLINYDYIFTDEYDSIYTEVAQQAFIDEEAKNSSSS